MRLIIVIIVAMIRAGENTVIEKYVSTYITRRILQICVIRLY